MLKGASYNPMDVMNWLMVTRGYRMQGDLHLPPDQVVRPAVRQHRGGRPGLGAPGRAVPRPSDGYVL